MFTPEEDQPGAGNEAVLSYRAWKKRFGSDPNIVGQTLMLNNQAYRVVGVMGPSFNWPNQAELWVPIAFPPARYHDPNYRYNENLFAVARLQPGVTLQQANAYLDRKAQENIASEGSKSFGRASGWGMFAMPLTEFIGGSLRKPLTMLLIAVGMVLLIACANIAGLADGAGIGARARSGDTRRLGRATRPLAAPGAGGKHRADRRRSRAWLRGSAGDCSAVAALSARHAGHADSAFLPRSGAAVRDRHCRALFAALRTGSGVAAHPAGLVQRAAGGRPLGHRQPGAPTRALVAGGGADRAVAVVADRRRACC